MNTVDIFLSTIKNEECNLWAVTSQDIMHYYELEFNMCKNYVATIPLEVYRDIFYIRLDNEYYARRFSNVEHERLILTLLRRLSRGEAGSNPLLD